jgi:hypothetical protein
MTAAADAPISALDISPSFPGTRDGRRVVATDTVSHFVMRSYEFRQVALICISALGFPAPRGGRGFNPFRIAPPSIGVRRLSEPEVTHKLGPPVRQRGLPLAIAQFVSAHGVIALEFVDASLVGTGIGDADTGIVGVSLYWWSAEGCHRYDPCPETPISVLFISSSFPDALMVAVLSPLQIQCRTL